MAATESGVYRVFESVRAAEEPELLLLEKGTEEPVYVRADGYEGALQDRVKDLRPGNLVRATLEWGADGDAFFADLTVETETIVEFVDGADHVFEQAERTFEEGRRERMPIYSNVTYGTDGDANGVIYTFAKQDSEKDIFGEFRDGRMTLEPMIDKLGDGGAEPPFEVFVIRPEDEPFHVVFLTLEREGLLANTIREEYDCPRA